MPRELNITLDLSGLTLLDLRPIVSRRSATQFEVDAVAPTPRGKTMACLGTFSARGAGGNARDRRRARRRTDRAIAMLIAKHGAVLSEGSCVR